MLKSIRILTENDFCHTRVKAFRQRNLIFIAYRGLKLVNYCSTCILRAFAIKSDSELVYSSILFVVKILFFCFLYANILFFFYTCRDPLILLILWNLFSKTILSVKYRLHAGI